MELEDLLARLLEFSARHLVNGGILACWIPRSSEDLRVVELPSHPQLRKENVCVQYFNKCNKY